MRRRSLAVIRRGGSRRGGRVRRHRRSGGGQGRIPPRHAILKGAAFRFGRLYRRAHKHGSDRLPSALQSASDEGDQRISNVLEQVLDLSVYTREAVHGHDSIPDLQRALLLGQATRINSEDYVVGVEVEPQQLIPKLEARAHNAEVLWGHLLFTQLTRKDLRFDGVTQLHGSHAIDTVSQASPEPCRHSRPRRAHGR